MRLRLGLLIAGLSAGPLLLNAGIVQPAAARPASPYAAQDRQEAKDEKLLDRVERDASTRGLAAIGSHAAALQAALAGAPAVYPKREVREDVVVVRTSGDLSSVLVGLMMQAGAGPEGKPKEAVARRNVYPTMAFYLGSYNFEQGRLDVAEATLRKCLAWQPHDALCVNETAVVLSRQNRNDEALALIDAALASDDPTVETHRARLHRGRGFQLIELQRLDEAQAAYNEALKLEPNHRGAQGQIDYIAELRRGGAQREPSYPLVDPTPN